MTLAAIAIGRNEGARLIACLDALAAQVDHVIYVDSGSTDGSVEAALERGAEVVKLDMEVPFTAARARNAGLARLMPDVEFVQLVDGDCTLVDGWITTAQAFLRSTPKAAVACGRRREIAPQASVYNAMCDAEWDTPIGVALACGGDALMRRSALEDAGGYRENLIAGEEPEMCLRLRQSGWTIHRLDAEMTRHDAQILRLGQWWKRTRRAGHAFAEGAALHGAPPERHWVKETRRCLLWGALLPLAILLLSVVSIYFILLICVYPLQWARLVRSGMKPHHAVLNVIGKFAEARGALEYWVNRIRRKRARLIEYK